MHYMHVIAHTADTGLLTIGDWMPRRGGGCPWLWQWTLGAPAICNEGPRKWQKRRKTRKAKKGEGRTWMGKAREKSTDFLFIWTGDQNWGGRENQVEIRGGGEREWKMRNHPLSRVARSHNSDLPGAFRDLYLATAGPVIYEYCCCCCFVKTNAKIFVAFPKQTRSFWWRRFKRRQSMIDARFQKADISIGFHRRRTIDVPHAWRNERLSKRIAYLSATIVCGNNTRTSGEW